MQFNLGVHYFNVDIEYDVCDNTIEITNCNENTPEEFKTILVNNSNKLLKEIDKTITELREEYFNLKVKIKDISANFYGSLCFYGKVEVVIILEISEPYCTPKTFLISSIRNSQEDLIEFIDNQNFSRDTE